MFRLTYPLVAGIVLLVIGFGLLRTLKEAVEVAPLVHEGPARGRLLLHTKNVSRISGSSEEIYQTVQRAIQYPQAKGVQYPPTPENWERYVLESIQIQDNPQHLILLPAGDQQALQWALPGIFYARWYGSPTVLVGPQGPLNPEVLEQYPDLPRYALAAEHVLPGEALRGLGDFERIAGSDWYDHAVKLAEYRNEETEMGWGREHERRTGYFHYVVTAPNDALNGLAALPYAVTNNATLLYSANNGGIPSALDRYMFAQRTDWMITPSEGPFRHFWVVSDLLSYTGQGRLDFSIEKAEYASMGAVALGDLEALLLVWILLGIATAFFVMIHSSYHLPAAGVPMKIAWGLACLLLPVFGAWLYFSAYRRPWWKDDNGMTHWLRPQSIQAASATVMGFGYGATLMIAVGYIFAYFGFPLFFPVWLSESIFWLGAGMPLMMIGMYVFAVLVAWPLVQYPMKQMMGMPKKKARWMSLKVTALSMLSVSLGMMTLSWVMMMWKIPMMPHEDDILWFGSLWVASLIGFFVAWPLNWLMVRGQLKPGNT